MLSGSINTELYFIYGLIVVVILLIILVLIIDRKDAKRDRRRLKLTDTLNMKPITDDMIRDSKYRDDVEVVEIESDTEKELYDNKSIPEIKVELEKSGLLNDEEEVYHDTELEKTQAQIRVEEITKALEDAKVDEKIEEEKDKYADYEEEQEKNAFISYEDLKNSYDRLYKENEQKQYVEDNSIPINIKELYEANNMEKEYRVKYVDNASNDDDVELLDTDDSNKKKTFKSSVLDVNRAVKNNIDKDIKNASDFLTTLKELRNNL